MEFYVQKAKLYAMETAKRSQEIASQAAILSLELATETAKRSKELATETAKRSKDFAIDVTKKADQLKAYAGELTPSIVVPRGPSSAPLPSEEELQDYGITPQLREFVKGFTIKTFMDFAIDGPDGGFRTASRTNQIVKQDLTPWRERHAVLVLLAVKEVSDFRYVLCPRRMNETRFWRVYFALVKNQISGQEALALEKVVVREEDIELLSQEEDAVGEPERDLRLLPLYSGEEGVVITREADSSFAKSTDHDLDAYLMGSLDSSDDGRDGDEDDRFDADFDQLVNSAVRLLHS